MFCNSRIDNKAYWLDKDALTDVKEKYFREGHWDREGVKGYLALPCFNQANDMINVELTENQTVVQSTIGKATELLKYDGAHGYTTGTIGKIMGGDRLETRLRKLGATSTRKRVKSSVLVTAT